MKRIVAAISLALLGFYLGWPAWTGYKIRQAFETEDAVLLESKVDFDSVRASLKPVVAAEADAYFERLKRDVGPLGGLLSNQVKGEVAGRLVEATVNVAITPPNVIRMVRDGRSVKQSLEKVIFEQAGTGGGFRLPGRGVREDKTGVIEPANTDFGRNPEAHPRAVGQPVGGDTTHKGGDAQERQRQPQPRLGLSNIKSITIDSPLAFSVGVSKDPTATEPEVRASLRFTGGDWKVVALNPNFAARRANLGQ